MDTANDGQREDDPLRLLILTDSPILVSGGSERFLRNLLEQLPAQNYRITLVQLCEEPPECALVQSRLPASVGSSIFLPFASLYGGKALRAYRSVRKMLQQEGFDIIQSQHEKSDVFNACLPRGRRRALRVSNRRDMGFLKSGRLRRLSRVLNRRIDLFVAPSPAILEATARDEGVPRNRMRCIPNGVDTERFKPVDAELRRAARASIDCMDDDLLVGCVADLFPVKRHEDLVDAFARLRASMPAARLVLIGDGPLRDEIKQQTIKQGLADAVRLLGPRRDVHVLLPALDLFALASDSEGLSNAILEAQACGLPVVATQVGGNPDLVDRTCGSLVAARDPEGLAQAIAALLRDPAERVRMGQAARRRVVQKYSLDAMAQAYAALYRGHAHVG